LNLSAVITSELNARLMLVNRAKRFGGDTAAVINNRINMNRDIF